MEAALQVLRRVETALLDSTSPELALDVTNLILRVEGIHIEEPTTQEEVLRACAELQAEDPMAQRTQDAAGAKNLLIELVKRTSHDWVLYRGSRNLEKRRFAEDAYNWLFVEDENHHHWRVRESEGKQITSFLSICEALDMDPDNIRAKIRTLTLQKVMASGRPPSHPRSDVYDAPVPFHATMPSEDVEDGFAGGYSPPF